MKEVSRSIMITEYEYDSEGNVVKEITTTTEYEPDTTGVNYNITYGSGWGNKTWGTSGGTKPPTGPS